MVEPLALRPPGPPDARAAAELHHRSWIATYGPLLPPDQAARLTLAERVEHWERLLSEHSADRGALVAERAGRIVGLVEWEIGPDGDRAVGEVHAIHVAPEDRGRGTGTLLLDAAVQAMHFLGVRRTVLWVLEDNRAARRFYKSQGWVWDGTRIERSLGGFADFPTVIEVRYVLDVAGP
jgi:ribosomal protein S18 acetylase RimI-like enzyme